MQEEINQKTISVAIKGGKITADVLKSALRFLLKKMQESAAKSEAQKGVQEEDPLVHGKQSLEDLQKNGTKLTNIQVTDQNIGSFDKVARKYSIDYALKKDKSVSPPVYYVFFKAKDVDVMQAAFKEYTNEAAKKQTRPSVCQKLRKALETVRNTVTPQKDRHKHQEQSR